MVNQISAKIVKDSIGYNTDCRVTTIQVRVPKFLLAEINTHRVFSRSFNSSRAIPTRTIRDRVHQDPFEPIFWGGKQPGMQASEQLGTTPKWLARAIYRSSARSASIHHWALERLGLHKQHANRILEPYMWADGVITGTEWSNFLLLRNHPAAQPEFKDLAEKIDRQLKECKPDSLAAGEYHLPYIDERDWDWYMSFNGKDIDILKRISASRCARVSYGFSDIIDRGKDLARADRLLNALLPHISPFEHVAMAMGNDLPYRNFRGWKQFRQEIEEATGFLGESNER